MNKISKILLSIILLVVFANFFLASKLSIEKSKNELLTTSKDFTSIYFEDFLLGEKLAVKGIDFDEKSEFYLIVLLTDKGCTVCVSEVLEIIDNENIYEWVRVFYTGKKMNNLFSSNKHLEYSNVNIDQFVTLKELPIKNPLILLMDSNRTIQMIDYANIDKLEKTRKFLERVKVFQNYN